MERQGPNDTPRALLGRDERGDSTASADNAYLPPLELFGAALIFFCKEQRADASGAFRVAGDQEPGRLFVASYSIESVLHLERQFVPPLYLQYKTDPGSDSVCIAVVGHSHRPGHWNMLA